MRNKLKTAQKTTKNGGKRQISQKVNGECYILNGKLAWLKSGLTH
jgi:hypothetical protein